MNTEKTWLYLRKADWCLPEGRDESILLLISSLAKDAKGTKKAFGSFASFARQIRVFGSLSAFSGESRPFRYLRIGENESACLGEFRR
jgi:hypothetical protein